MSTRRSVSSCLLALFISLVCLFSLPQANGLRKGDAVRGYVLSDTPFMLRGLYVCLDSELLLPKGSRIEFQGGVTSSILSQNTALILEGHEGIVQHLETESMNNEGDVVVGDSVKISVRWNRCSFDVDDSTAMQVLFAVGSIASIIVFVAILFDSRGKRPDKYS